MPYNYKRTCNHVFSMFLVSNAGNKNLEELKCKYWKSKSLMIYKVLIISCNSGYDALDIVQMHVFKERCVRMQLSWNETSIIKVGQRINGVIPLFFGKKFSIIMLMMSSRRSSNEVPSSSFSTLVSI